MLISIGYDISLWISRESTVLYTLKVHPSRKQDLVDDEEHSIEPKLPVEDFIDCFGNHCNRVHCPVGPLRLQGSGLIRDSGERDIYVPDACQVSVDKIPHEILQFLMPSRYCEVDSELGYFAWENFQKVPEGWARVEAISNFVHDYVKFDYMQARANRTALDTFRERVGVCRDFTHLAITLCRCLNIPARYVTGYLGDIGVPPEPPMDFSAWMEVYLGGQWYAFDPRNKIPRIGRVVIAHGRDACDVAIATVFGGQSLQKFMVRTLEVPQKESESESSLKVEAIAKSSYRTYQATC